MDAQTDVFDFRQLAIEDYREVYALWETTEGVGLSASDQKEQIGNFLDRNPNLSFVARDAGRIVGVIMCGHDGRRGYIHHLAVSPQYRRRGIGRRLVSKSLNQLRQAGILKCHLFIFTENLPGAAFWRDIGWTERRELKMMSKVIEVQPAAI